MLVAAVCWSRSGRASDEVEGLFRKSMQEFKRSHINKIITSFIDDIRDCLARKKD